MGNQFNFYQTDGQTGRFFTWSGHGPSFSESDGPYTSVGPLPFLFINPISSLFSGVYRSKTIDLGETVGFLWNIDNDGDRYIKILDVIVDSNISNNPTQYYAKINGRVVDGNNQLTLLEYGYSGNAFGILKESGDFGVDFNGYPTGQAWDSCSYNGVLTGCVSGIPLDTCFISGRLSGSATGWVNEACWWYSVYSGNVESCLNTAVSFSPYWEGNVGGQPRDTGNFTFALSEVNFKIVRGLVTIESGDNMDFDFNLSEVIFSLR